MSYTWFKLHHDLPDDIKLRRFTAQEKWAWVALLCLASKEKTRGHITAEDEDIAEYCEFNSPQDWLYYRDKLIAKGMLEINGDGNLSILHWEDRQYDKPSDKPEAVKARVSKHRAAKKAAKKVSETPCNALQTQGNADVTPQTRLDTDQTRQEEIRKESLRSNPEGEARENQALLVEQPQMSAPIPAPDIFARRGMPQVVTVQAQFQGPWGVGYTDELKAFEKWLLSTKAKGKTDPSAWMAAVVTGIAKGGSRALWDEFERSTAPTPATQPRKLQAIDTIDDPAEYQRRVWSMGA
jgi:hypothetical protein